MNICAGNRKCFSRSLRLMNDFTNNMSVCLQSWTTRHLYTTLVVQTMTAFSSCKVCTTQISQNIFFSIRTACSMAGMAPFLFLMLLPTYIFCVITQTIDSIFYAVETSIKVLCKVLSWKTLADNINILARFCTRYFQTGGWRRMQRPYDPAINNTAKTNFCGLDKSFLQSIFTWEAYVYASKLNIKLRLVWHLSQQLCIICY